MKVFKRPCSLVLKFIPLGANSGWSEPLGTILSQETILIPGVSHQPNHLSQVGERGSVYVETPTCELQVPGVSS